MNAAPISRVGLVARSAVAAGISIVPPKEDGTKRPDGAWKRYQSAPPTAEEVDGWYGPRTGLGFVCGAVSGGLELFELDADLYEEFRSTAVAVGLGPLLDRIEAGYLERSPGGGWHWFYYCDEVRGNTKLAQRPGTIDPETGRPTVEVLFETRGEGGYAVVAPSNGKVHSSGGRYELISGGPGTIATISAEERDELWALARTFDRMPVPDAAPPPKPQRAGESAGESAGDVRPGDAFNAEVTWDELIGSRGWKRLYTRGDTTYWRRPGKSEGWSATTNRNGSDLLWVFSTSTEFEANRSYTKFGCYAVLEAGGNHTSAAKSLADQGYGSPRNGVMARSSPRTGPIPGGDGPGHSGGSPAELRVVSYEPEVERFNRTDTGNALRFARDHKGKIRYCMRYGKWLLWDRRRWREDTTGAVYRLALKTIRRMWTEGARLTDPDDRKAVLAWAQATESRKLTDAMIYLARTVEGVPVDPSELDSDPMLLNAKNGTIDLRTGLLAPHRPEDLITKLVNVDYDPSSTCPRFDRFQREIMDGDESMVEYLLRIAGYGMTGDVREHVLFFFFGDGRNGKSLWLTIVQWILGDYACTVNASLITVKHQDDHPTGLTDLEGRRFVSTIEVEDGKAMAEALVKQLTGGDPIKARRMRQDFYQFDPTHKIILAANHRPEIRGTDVAIWDRVKLIPFPVTFVDEGKVDVAAKRLPKDKGLEAKLKAEAQGILASMVRSCLDWQREGLKEPSAVVDATRKYREDMDVIAGFIEERCVVNPRGKYKATELYKAYCSWAKETNQREVMEARDFGSSLEKRGFTLKKSNSIAWRTGIGIAADPGDDFDPNRPY